MVPLPPGAQRCTPCMLGRHAPGVVPGILGQIPVAYHSNLLLQRAFRGVSQKYPERTSVVPMSPCGHLAGGITQVKPCPVLGILVGRRTRLQELAHTGDSRRQLSQQPGILLACPRATGWPLRGRSLQDLVGIQQLAGLSQRQGPRFSIICRNSRFSLLGPLRGPGARALSGVGREAALRDTEGAAGRRRAQDPLVLETSNDWLHFLVGRPLAAGRCARNHAAHRRAQPKTTVRLTPPPAKRQ
mmetsp:Transcript_100700/g.285383  ORF Transcript_100700/g.285383 Transcript_100700/m.285383 type:complete len:243 (+) Transcript_100700:819-1547(+)